MCAAEDDAVDSLVLETAEIYLRRLSDNLALPTFLGKCNKEGAGLGEIFYIWVNLADCLLI